MMAAATSTHRRHTKAFRCPVCDGAEQDPRGVSRRCCGFTTADGFAHCSREEYGGDITRNGHELFPHRLHGPCKCGKQHGAPRTNGKGVIVATYDYADETGQRLFQVVRKDPKAFLQRKPIGDGWSWSTKGVRRVPYRLPELCEADPERRVFVVEGEKDADALAELGELATCNAGGAGKWTQVAATARKVLEGRSVCIIADADVPGRKHADEVAASLHGVTLAVRVIEMPPPHNDVSDFLAAGGTISTLSEMVSAAPLWELGSGGAPPSSRCDLANEELPAGVDPFTDLANAHRPRSGPRR